MYSATLSGEALLGVIPDGGHAILAVAEDCYGQKLAVFLWKLYGKGEVLTLVTVEHDVNHAWISLTATQETKWTGPNQSCQTVFRIELVKNRDVNGYSGGADEKGAMVVILAVAWS